jgi:CRISPR-associated protein Cst2
MVMIKGLTATILFESSAVNGDANVGIQSIKKLSRDNGVYSFMSRAFLRNKAFSSLEYLANWEEAPLTFDKDVIQFNFPEANIVQYPEMDIFGFMNTSVCGSDKISVTRKAPLGMTKAISLEPYRSDTAFYANHNLVKRANEQLFRQTDGQAKKANPNPYTKEEHFSLYRLSYTIDLCRLGFQEVAVITSTDNKKDVGKQKALKQIKDWLNNFPTVEFKSIKINPLYRLTVDGEKMKWHIIVDHNGNTNSERVLGYIGSFTTNNDKDMLLTFVISEEERKKRLTDLLTVITNGLTSHSRTEEYGVNPILITLATLTVPMPLFHSRIKWNGRGLDETPLNSLIESNTYISKAWYKDDLNLCPGIKKESSDAKKYEELSVEDVLKEIR